MTSSIVHRGPDDEGIVTCGRAGIGARRLSIIDVDGGHQPIANEDGSIWCALNGEIYNHPDLIAEMVRRGHAFKSRCDTEVIVHLYEEFGADFVTRLDGMFAVVVWDSHKDTVILARDRLGIKPLYYADLGDRLLFASEIKALLAAGCPQEVDPVAVDAYFTLSYVPAPLSIYRRAKKLLPGHMLIWKSGQKMRQECYWQLPSDPPAAVVSAQQAGEQLLELLRAAVKRHMISDVPIGAFLSGGVDSSLVVRLMAEHSAEPVRTFSVGFAEKSYDETPYAREVARMIGAEHHELVQRPDARTMVDLLPRLYDEPFGDPAALATHSVARLARDHVKVVLTGDGGDELFGGYLAYRAARVAALYRRLPAPVRNRVFPAILSRLPPSTRKTSVDYQLRRLVSAGDDTPAGMHLGWRTIVHPDIRRELVMGNGHTDLAAELMYSYFSMTPANDAVAGALYTDMRLELPDNMMVKVDRATMAVSLEARVPLLDLALVQFMATLPSWMKVRGWSLKYLLRRAARQVLPRDILDRKKGGFNLPIAQWLRADLRDVMLDALSSENLRSSGLIDVRVAERIAHAHLHGGQDRSRELWALLAFALWHASGSKSES
jgi:asparagine synthase (glutamine-hydrolysing)